VTTGKGKATLFFVLLVSLAVATVGIMGFEATSYVIKVFGVDEQCRPPTRTRSRPRPGASFHSERPARAARRFWKQTGSRAKGGGEVTAEAPSLLCAQGCEWFSIGDGKCNPQCDNAACFDDRGDCVAGATECKRDCHEGWIGDGCRAAPEPARAPPVNSHRALPRIARQRPPEHLPRRP
jgi:hypothetical protein